MDRPRNIVFHTSHRNALRGIVAFFRFAGLALLTGCQTLPSFRSDEDATSAYVQQNTAAPSAATADKGPARLFKSPRKKNNSSAKANLKLAPQSIVAIWTDTSLRLPGKMPTRGLGGRLYFYDAKGKSIPVTGQLVVYGYDDSIDGTEKTAPDRKYVFAPNEFANHYAESDLGPSYSVWIPWDAIGSPQTMVSVLPSFTTTDGNLVMGDLARHVLPGPKSPLDQRKPQQQTTRMETQVTRSGVVPQQGGVALASYSADVAGNVQAGSYPAAERTMRSTSIPLPESVKQRLVQTPPQSNRSIGSNRSVSSMSPEEIRNLAAELMRSRSTAAVQARAGQNLTTVQPAAALPSGTPGLFPQTVPGSAPIPMNQTAPTQYNSPSQTQNNSPLTQPAPMGQSPHSRPGTPLALGGSAVPPAAGQRPSARNLSSPPVHPVSTLGFQTNRSTRSAFPHAAALPGSNRRQPHGY